MAASATAPSAPAMSTTPIATITARGMPMAPARRRRFGGTGPRDAPSSLSGRRQSSAVGVLDEIGHGPPSPSSVHLVRRSPRAQAAELWLA